VMMRILAVYWVQVFPAIAAGHWDGQIIRVTSTRPAHTVFFPASGVGCSGLAALA